MLFRSTLTISQDSRVGGRIGYFGRLVAASHVSAISGECLFVRKSVFDEVGGFRELGLQGSDPTIDLCLRLSSRGYATVITPHARVRRFGSVKYKSLPNSPIAHSDEAFENGYREAADPFYNPNLSFEPRLFDLAFPPRRSKPWDANSSPTVVGPVSVTPSLQT